MASPSPVTSTESLVRNTLALCQTAREAGLAVTPAREIDIFRALKSIDWHDVDDYRLVLRTNLASGRADEILFDRVFNTYWGEPAEADSGDYILARSEMIRGSLDVGRSREGHRDMLTEAESFAGEEVTRNPNLIMRWDSDAPPLEKVIRELARRLATRPSRRTQPARHGRRIDLRRSVRRNIRHGLDLVELSRVARKTRKTRIVMLCDVSGSMDVFNSFLLQLMFGLQQTLRNSRTFVFSTRVSEISAVLRRRNIEETLNEISRTVRHWSGGTNIGAALGELNRTVLREGTSRSTVLLVISDGYDNGETERIERELESARRRIRTLVWINPMYGATTFTVRAAGMRAAMPYIDHFLPAFHAKALHVLVKGLIKMR